MKFLIVFTRLWNNDLLGNFGGKLWVHRDERDSVRWLKAALLKLVHGSLPTASCRIVNPHLKKLGVECSISEEDLGRTFVGTVDANSV